MIHLELFTAAQKNKRRVRPAQIEFPLSSFTNVLLIGSLAGCAVWESSSRVVALVSIGH